MADSAVATFYSRWAGLYDILATRTPGIRRLRTRAVDALALESGDTVIDVGCGTGANLPLLRDRVGPTGRVLGVDVAPGALDRARTRVDRRGWTTVDVVRADGARLPVTNADAVLGTFVVGMFPDPATTVRSWGDLVAPDGRLVLVDATPRGRTGIVDRAFRLFVAASTPPTTRLRYPDSPTERLGERVTAGHRALADAAADCRTDRYARGFLRVTAGTVR